MSVLFKIIGAIIFSIIMYAIPILFTLSLARNWGAEVQAPLFFLCIMQLIYIIEKNIERED